jgi:hypothetical protein
MNPLRTWLDKSRARRQAEHERRPADVEELTARVEALVLTFRDRLRSQSFAFIVDQLAYGEPELAIDMLWSAIDAGDVVASRSERSELIELTRHPGVDPRGLSTAGRKHLLA